MEFDKQCRVWGQAPVITGKAGTIKFMLPAHFAPLHSLGAAAATAIPFVESKEPWFATAWKVQQGVVLPSGRDVTAEISYIRAIQGKITVKWTPNSQRLDVKGAYCEAKYSDAQISREWVSMKGDIKACDPSAVRAAKNLAAAEDCYVVFRTMCE